MRTTRKRVGAAASVAVLALTLTAACSSGGGSTDEPSASASGIPEAQRVGSEPLHFERRHRDEVDSERARPSDERGVERFDAGQRAMGADHREERAEMTEVGIEMGEDRGPAVGFEQAR